MKFVYIYDWCRVGVVYDSRMLEHQCIWEPNYPENPERLKCAMERCRSYGLIDRCISVPVRMAAFLKNKINSTVGAVRVGDIRCLHNFFISDIIVRKSLTLKMKVKVTEYTIYNGLIQRQISTSIKVTLEHFSLALTIFRISTFQNSWPWKCKSKSWCTTFTVASFKCKYLISCKVTL